MSLVSAGRASTSVRKVSCRTSEQDFSLPARVAFVSRGVPVPDVGLAGRTGPDGNIHGHCRPRRLARPCTDGVQHGRHGHTSPFQRDLRLGFDLRGGCCGISRAWLTSLTFRRGEGYMLVLFVLPPFTGHAPVTLPPRLCVDGHASQHPLYSAVLCMSNPFLSHIWAGCTWCFAAAIGLRCTGRARRARAFQTSATSPPA